MITSASPNALWPSPFPSRPSRTQSFADPAPSAYASAPSQPTAAPSYSFPSLPAQAAASPATPSYATRPPEPSHSPTSLASFSWPPHAQSAPFPIPPIQHAASQPFPLPVSPPEMGNCY